MIQTLLLAAAPTAFLLALLAALLLAFVYEPPKPAPACCQIWEHSAGRAHGPDCTRKDPIT